MWLSRVSNTGRIFVKERCLLKKGKLLNAKHHPKSTVVILRRHYAKTSVFPYFQINDQSKSLVSHGNMCRINSNGMKGHVQVRFYTLPSYTKIVLPALSPTMETGTIVQWQLKEGDHFSTGDLLADIETDKATMGFEANDDGYLAKILVVEGTKDVPLGTLVAISVENEEDIAAFKDVSADQLNNEMPSAPSDKQPPAQVVSESNQSAMPQTSYPSHESVLLPALSPTMTTGSIVAWEKQEGDKIEEGDSIATIETDKASMALEYQDEGYIAKILMKEGAKDLPLGTPLCIIVSKQEDVSAFSNYSDPGVSLSSPAEKQATSTQSLLPEKEKTSIPPPIPRNQTPAKPMGDRLFASPLAKKIAAEKGLDLKQFADLGSGPKGRIRAQDLSKVPTIVTTPAPTPTPTPSLSTPLPGADFTDIPLSSVRKVIAKRLLESKLTIPHYYLTVDVTMDKVMEMRKTFNKDLESEDTKLSVNDFVIKAAALACLKVPEANSSWQDTFIRQFNTVDMSIAVSTDNGLITPIVFNAHAKGLVSISKDVVALATKAREGKLQPQEFQGGTFTISNLGMFGIKHFTAIINPPQSCILAVGSARREFIPDSEAEDGKRAATLMSVTLSCDHRVVDGAVGAQWLQQFKKFLETPAKMLL